MGRRKSDVCWITSEVFTSDNSAVWARKLILGRGQAFLAFVIALAKEEKKDLQDILVVQDYPDVFSRDYFGLHHRRRWSLGLSACQTLILYQRHHIG
jgi:hypothetical protein